VKILLHSANLGSFDPFVPSVEQELPSNVKLETYLFTDVNFLPRFRAMTPRMQARIPKMFCWQLFPDFDYYLWVDASCTLSSRKAVWWFLEQCAGADSAFFLHPDRKSIREEYLFLKQQLEKGNKYLERRYAGEFLEEQYQEIYSDYSYRDDLLIASTAFIYQNTLSMHRALKEWWYHTSRFHIIDQLSLPYVLKKSGTHFNLIKESYLDISYLKYVRNA